MDIVITLNKKEYGFKFTSLTLIMYCENRKISLSDFDKDVNENFLLSNNIMLQCAYERYYDGEKKLDRFQLDDFLTELPEEDHNKLMTCYAKSIYGMVTKYIPKGDSKKK